MINYSRLGYEIKRYFTNFSEKLFRKDFKRIETHAGEIRSSDDLWHPCRK